MTPKQEIDLRFEEHLATGSAIALGRAFELAGPELIRIGLAAGLDRASAEDALQETFLVLVRRRPEYRGDRGLMPWAAGIMARQAKAAQRIRRREQDFVAALKGELGSEPFVDEHAGEGGQGLNLAAALDDVRVEVTRALRQLPEGQRNVVRLRFVEGLRPAEIGARLALTPNAVSARLMRGTRRLREVLSRGALGVLVLVLSSRQARGTAQVGRDTVELSGRIGFTTGAGIGGAAAPAMAVAAVAVAVAIGAIALSREPVLGTDWRSYSVPEPARDIADLVAPASTAEEGGERTPGHATLDGRSPSGAVFAPLTGVVVHANGTPAPGVPILALPYERAILLPAFELEPLTHTDGEGRFSIPSDALETLGDPTPLLLARGQGVTGWDFVVGVGADVRMVLVPELGLDLRVVDGLGDPVVGAQVGVYTMSEFLVRGSNATQSDCGSVSAADYVHLFGGVTDAAGMVRVRSIPPVDAVNSQGVFGVFAEGFLDRVSLVMWPRAGDTLQVEVALKRDPALGIRGRVVDDSGHPLAGAWIRCALRGGSATTDEVLARTDAAGAYAIPADWPVRLPVVLACGLQGYEQRQAELSEENFAERAGGTDFVLRKDVPLVGQVVDDLGNGVPGVNVRRVSLHAIGKVETDRDGRFRFDEVADEPATLHVSVSVGAGTRVDGLQVWTTVPGGREPIELALRAPQRVRDRVRARLVDARSGAPLPIREARFLAAEVEEFDGIWPFVTLDAGRAVACDLPEGEWLVYLQGLPSGGYDHVLHAVGRVDISGDRAQDLEIEVESGAPASIEMRLGASALERPGRYLLIGSCCAHPAAPLWFAGNDRAGRPIVYDFLDPKAPVLLEMLFPGRWEFSVSGPDGMVGEPRWVDLRPGETASLDWDLEQGGTLNLTLPPLQRSGHVEIEFRRSPAEPWMTVSRFTSRRLRSGSHIDSVPSGRFEWRARIFDRELPDDPLLLLPEASGVLEIAPGAKIEIDLDDPALLLD